MIVIVIVILIIASILVIGWTLFQSIDDIKSLENRKITKIISIIITNFFKNLWMVVGMLFFLFVWYVVYQLLNN